MIPVLGNVVYLIDPVSPTSLRVGLVVMTADEAFVVFCVPMPHDLDQPSSRFKDLLVADERVTWRDPDDDGAEPDRKVGSPEDDAMLERMRAEGLVAGGGLVPDVTVK